LLAFWEAFFASIADTNIQGGFAGAGLVPLRKSEEDVNCNYRRGDQERM
jgi:hypothetical protein